MTTQVTLTAKTLIIIIIVSAIAGVAGGIAGDYLTGERHAFVPATTRDVYLFTDSLNFNETILGIPHDIFSPDRIVVNQGDTVTIHYYNLEDVNEPHTFTLAGAPFWTQSSVTVQGADWNNGNIIVQQNHNVNITFVANTAGVYAYMCTFHQPTMTGYLIVLLE